MNPKGLIGPILIGIAGGIASIWIGWWAWLVVLGFLIGYWDRIPLRSIS